MSAAAPGPNPAVANYRSLRRLVGIIGVLLPVALIVGNVVAHAIEHSSCASFPESVSGYYYTPVRNVFVGVLWAIGVFLVAYTGSDVWDRTITDAAGVLAIIVPLFPTKPALPSASPGKSAPRASCGVVTHLSTIENVAGDIHLIAATLLFLMLAWMAMRFANKLPHLDAQPADAWGPFYVTCAAVILACVVAAAIVNFTVSSSLPVLFILETVAIEAFGISWLVKGVRQP